MILSQAQVVDESVSRHNTTNMAEDKNEGTQSDMTRKMGSRKYAALRTNLNEEVSSSNDMTQERVPSSLTKNDGNDSREDISPAPPSSALSSKWESMMHGFRSLRSNIDSKRFLPLGNSSQTSAQNSRSSFESLDEIFERLKRPPSEYRDSGE